MGAATKVALATTSSQGMIAGQVIDLESENKIVDGDTLRVMHQKKTGALIKAALKSGAIVSGAREEKLQALEEFAGHLGLAFQITDDILDFTADENILGKPTGRDIRQGVITLPALYALRNSPAASAETRCTNCLVTCGPASRSKSRAHAIR